MNRRVRTTLVYGVLLMIMLTFASRLYSEMTGPKELGLPEFYEELAEGRVDQVTIFEESNRLEGRFKDSTRPEGQVDFFVQIGTRFNEALQAALAEAGVNYLVDNEPPGIGDYLWSLLPFLIMLGLFVFIFTQMQGTGNRVMQFGRSSAKTVSPDQPKVTFGDVAGLEEAIEELEEIKDFLQNPDKYRALGAKIPKGILLFGPPGTGKTLLARAVAGEAGVPFFTISGSDFVEMFVGVGASRVRDLFDKAKVHAPAIVFIDEIDAVGRHRGAGLGGGHDEREQTLNQLLVELDGFEGNSGVIVIAATNRPDILDPALLRPGRFDRQITVDAPDIKGRQAVLEVHAKGKPLADEVDLELLARRTPGFTGADLANLINEAALLTARRGKDIVGMDELEEAIDRVIAGPERKTRIMTDEEKKLIAYHETGHALVGWALPNTDPVHKITIVSRGRSLGHTLSLPTHDRFLQKRSELVDKLAMYLGGRTAEEIVFGDPTTGASEDIERATEIARSMVMQYGMSDRLGPLKYGKPLGEVFLGRDYARGDDYSDDVAASIDEEIRALISAAHQEARDILETYRGPMDRMVQALLEKETVGPDEVAEIFSDVPKWEHGTNGGLKARKPSGTPKKTAAGSKTKART